MTQWNPLAESVDRFLIGGRLTPGLGELVAPDSPRNWEERVGPGFSGAVVVFRGVKPSHFGIKFTLLTEQDWADWNAFAPIVAKPPFAKRPRALDIVHPLLKQIGITAIVVENVLAPQPSGDTGEWIVELKVIEYRRLKHSGVSKAEGSQAQPEDPVELEIEARRQEAKQKNDELAAP